MTLLKKKPKSIIFLYSVKFILNCGFTSADRLALLPHRAGTPQPHCCHDGDFGMSNFRDHCAIVNADIWLSALIMES